MAKYIDCLHLALSLLYFATRFRYFFQPETMFIIPLLFSAALAELLNVTHYTHGEEKLRGTIDTNTQTIVQEAWDLPVDQRYSVRIESDTYRQTIVVPYVSTIDIVSTLYK